MASPTNSQRSSVQIPAAGRKSLYSRGFCAAVFLTQICYAANSHGGSRAWPSNSASISAAIVVYGSWNSGGVPLEPSLSGASSLSMLRRRRALPVSPFRNGMASDWAGTVSIRANNHRA